MIPNDPGKSRSLTVKNDGEPVVTATTTHLQGRFILSALGIAWTDKVMTGSSSKREQHAH